MGHTVRGSTATSSAAIGLLKSGATVLVTKTVSSKESPRGNKHTCSFGCNGIEL